MRTKIQVMWLGSTLRLEARNRRLELRPTAEGIVVAHMDGDQETVAPLDPQGNPEQLLRDWLAEAKPTE